MKMAKNMITIELTPLKIGQTKNGKQYFSAILSTKEEQAELWVRVYYDDTTLMVDKLKLGNRVFVRGMLVISTENGLWVSVSAKEIQVRQYYTPKKEDYATEIDSEIPY